MAGWDLTREAWGNDDALATCVAEERGVRMRNDGDADALFRVALYGMGAGGSYTALFEGERTAGDGAVMYVVDEYNHVLGETTLGGELLIDLPEKAEHGLLVKVFPHSEVLVTKAALWCGVRLPVDRFAPDAPEAERYGHVEGMRDEELFLDRVLQGNVAVVVPTYPTQENAYPCAFVHARVQAYRQAGVRCDVICAFDYEGMCSYEFEGVRVLRMSTERLGKLLRTRRYRAILLHFFDERYARVLEESGVCGSPDSRTPVFLWSHNPETLYWDWPLFTAPYFCEPPMLTDEQVAEFKRRDAMLRRFNGMPNVSWVFVSEPLKRRSEETLGFSFNRAHVIPNLIDEQVFPFVEKPIEQRKRVFFVRKFDDIAHYAVDVNVAAIVELSHRACFSDMEFTVCGTGNRFDELVAPLRAFSNVHIRQGYLSRAEMAQLHSEHGIALYATRFDSQGVTMCEAAMSGLAVVSSQIDVAAHFLPNDQGLLCPVEDAAAYADAIERLYNEPAQFLSCCRACHDKVANLCGRSRTVDREITLIKRSGARSLFERMRLSRVDRQRVRRYFG